MGKIKKFLQIDSLEKLVDKYSFLLTFLLSAPVLWPFFVPGYWGVSDDLHIGWMYEMHQLISILQIPARYVPDLSFGFGYPLFNFYAPLPFYIGEIFHLSGFSLVGSVKAVFLISLPLSMFFMYKFLRSFSGVWVAVLGAVIYVYTPYRSTDIFVRGAIDEAFVFVFIPIFFLALYRLLTSNKINLKWISIGALSFAGLILSHNITAYMVLPFVAILFILFFFTQKNKTASLLNSVIMFLLSLLVSSFFWVPAIVESKLVKYDTVFNYWDHFPTLKQLITPYFGYGASVPGPGDGMSFFLGAFNILLLVIGVISIIKFKKFDYKGKSLLSFLLISTGVSIFMMDYRSIFIWKIVPLLPYFQFPWRFLTITTFTTSCLVFVLEKLGLPKYVFIIFSGLVILLNFNYFKPHFLGRNDSYYINRYIPTPVASDEYRKTGEEYLRLPLSTEFRPSKNFPRFFNNTNAVQSIVVTNSLDAEALIKTNQAIVLNYNKYNFPGWFATLDGKPVNIFSGKPYGQVSLNVPEGIHNVRITFKETKFRLIFDLISLMSFVSLVYFSLRKDLSKKS